MIPAGWIAGQPRREGSALRPNAMVHKYIHHPRSALSGDSAFNRLRSNAQSMIQKLSRAKENVSSKIADLQKQKESNDVARGRIVELKRSIANLNAEVSEKDRTLNEFEHKIQEIKDSLNSASSIFECNDARLDKTSRSAQDLQTRYSEKSVHLNVLNSNSDEMKILSLQATANVESGQIMAQSLDQLNKTFEFELADIGDTLLNLTSWFGNIQTFSRGLKDEEVKWGKFSDRKSASILEMGSILQFAETRNAVFRDFVERVEARLHQQNNQLIEFARSYGTFDKLVSESDEKCSSIDLLESYIQSVQHWIPWNGELQKTLNDCAVAIKDCYQTRCQMMATLGECVQALARRNASVENEYFEFKTRLESRQTLSAAIENHLSSQCSEYNARGVEMNNEIAELEIYIQQMLTTSEHNRKQVQTFKPDVEHLQEIKTSIISKIQEVILSIYQVSGLKNEELAKISEVQRLLQSELSDRLAENDLQEITANICKVVSFKTQQQEGLKNELVMASQYTRTLQAMRQLAQTDIDHLDGLLSQYRIKCTELETSLASSEMMKRDLHLQQKNEKAQLKENYEQKLQQIRTQTVWAKFESELNRAKQAQERQIEEKLRELEDIKSQQQRESRLIKKNAKIQGKVPNTDRPQSHSAKTTLNFVQNDGAPRSNFIKQESSQLAEEKSSKPDSLEVEDLMNNGRRVEKGQTRRLMKKNATFALTTSTDEVTNAFENHQNASGMTIIAKTTKTARHRAKPSAQSMKSNRRATPRPTNCVDDPVAAHRDREPENEQRRRRRRATANTSIRNIGAMKGSDSFKHSDPFSLN